MSEAQLSQTLWRQADELALRSDAGQPVRTLVSELTATLDTATPEAIRTAGAELVARAGAASGALGTMGLLLGAYRSDEPARTDAVRRAAADLCEAALAAQPDGAAGLAVRLASVCEALGESQRAEVAWAEAIRRDPLIAWLLGDDARAAAALAQLDPHSEPAEVARAAALLSQAAAQPRGSAAATQALAQAQRHADAVTTPALRALLAAVSLTIAGDREAAAERLCRDIAGLPRPVAEAVVDAIAELCLRPPHDVRAVLRAAYFDALLDPLGSLLSPRSPLADLRRYLVPLALASMLGSFGVGCASTVAGHPGAVPVVQVGGSTTTEAGAFDDAEELKAPEMKAGDMVELVKNRLWHDLEGIDRGGLLKMFDQAKTEKERNEIRHALHDALQDRDLVDQINASPERVARAQAIAQHLAPRDPSIAENAVALEEVKQFEGWGQYEYDVIVVTGFTPADSEAPVKLHEVAQKRVEEAVKSFKENAAPFILVTGANVYPRDTPYYEAIEMKKELIELGVPAGRILVDARARHSTTNLRNAGRIMLDNGMKRALIVACGGGPPGFDQAFYFSYPNMSTFNSRCKTDLGYTVGELERVDSDRVAFVPSPRVRTVGFHDPLDP